MMSIDIMWNSCLSCHYGLFSLRKQSYKLHRLCSKLGGIRKAWVLFNYCFAKEKQHIIFYAHVHACSPSYADEEWKTLQSSHCFTSIFQYWSITTEWCSALFISTIE